MIKWKYKKRMKTKMQERKDADKVEKQLERSKIFSDSRSNQTFSSSHD